MMTNPITPPQELVEKWINMFEFHLDAVVLTEVAQWGANQELDACCEWMEKTWWIDDELSKELRMARRPKPPSLKEQALMALEDGDLGPGASLTPVEVCIIRRALEQLDD